MENKVIETKQKKKSGKKIVISMFAVILFLLVSVGGFFGFKYMLPSGKDLFLIAHANLFDTDEEEIENYRKDTELSFDFNGNFLTKKAVDTVKTITVSTQNCKFGDKSIYDFNMQFLNRDFLSFSNIKSQEKTYLTVPQLMNETYASERTNDILSVLLGSDTAADIDVFEGVDKERFEEYLLKYGKKLYENVPSKSFVTTKNKNEKIITFKDSVNRMLYDIVNEIKNDVEFRNFLYEQTSIVYSNFNAKFPYVGTLLNMSEKTEYDKSYNETLDKFMEDIENVQIEISTTVKGRKLVREVIKIVKGEEPLYDVLYDENSVDFIQYKDNLENIHYSYTRKAEGEKIYKNTRFTIDVNEWTKEKVKGQKNFSVIINTTTDKNVFEEITLPEKYVDINTLSEEDKIMIQETAGKNLTELLTSFTLTLLML